MTNPTNKEVSELREKLLTYMTGMGVVAGIDEPDGQFQVSNKKFVDGILPLITQDRQALLDRVRDEVIGEDEVHTKYMKGRSATEDIREKRGWAWTITSRINNLKATQRKALNNILGESDE